MTMSCQQGHSWRLLERKVVIVTGAARGISPALLQRGASVLVAMRCPGRLPEVRQQHDSAAYTR